MDGTGDAPPPVGGLGNFKGVMLCNRPIDDMTSRLVGGEDQPFKSMISATHGEQIGLTPCRNYEQRTVKTRGPSAALRNHVRWLKELQEEMRGERAQAEFDAQQGEDRKRKMKAFFEKQRESVRQMMHERDRQRAEGHQPASSSSDVAPRKKAPPSKPLWAMTEKEKDDFEEGEADQLIDFAENLDYDKYVGDLEFRQALETLKDRTGKLQKEQDAFKDALLQDFNTKASEEDEGASTSAGPSPRRLEDGLEGQSVLGSEYSLGSSKRSRSNERAQRGDGRPEWDASTSCADDRPGVDRGIRETAEQLLEANPALRAVHSKESMQRIVEKQRERQAANAEPVLDLLQTMQRDGPAVTPVIVQSADTQQRLHKQVSASQLPYLYRCMQI